MTQNLYTFNIDPTKHLKELTKYDDIFITLRGVFLVLILFCASFLAPYIGCNYQSILKRNYYIRYLILFLVIYFSINFTEINTEKIPEHPIYAILKSIIILCLLLLLNNLNISVIVILLVLFALLIIVSKYHNYYKHTNLNSPQNVVRLEVFYISQLTISISIVILLFSSLFISYKDNEKLNINLNKCNINN
jgi:hypothetical protein